MNNKNIFLVPLFALLSLNACSINNPSEPEDSKPEPVEPSNPSKPGEEDDGKLPLNPLTPVYSYSFPNLGKEVMPISAWVAPWHAGGNNHITLQQYQNIKDAGLNSIYGLYERIGVNNADVFAALDLADQVGLTYLARDDSINALAEDDNDFIAHMEEFTAHPSFGGLLIKDEPGKASFDGLVPARKLFRKYYTKYAYFINLFPTYARGQQLSGDETEIDYDEYVDSYLKTIGPQMLSYDFYGLKTNFPEVKEDYFNQIYISKKYADQNKIPFWPFIQTCQFHSTYRLPNEADMYWQVGANLVFGAKAIQYFCYMCPYEEPDWPGNLIDFNGNKTDIYYYCQKVNKFITDIDHILMKSTLVDSMKFGESPAPLPEEFSFVTSSREIKSVETESNVIIGVFNHDGKTAAYVFNNDLVNEAYVTINFTTKVDVDIYDFTKKDSFAELDYVSVNLRPGTSALIDLTNY